MKVKGATFKILGASLVSCTLVTAEDLDYCTFCSHQMKMKELKTLKRKDTEGKVMI